MRCFFGLILLCMCSIFPIFASQNQVVVITGASRGVGLASAECLAKQGFTVYGTVRHSSKVPYSTKNLHFLPVDLMNENSIQAAVQTILENEGHIDILINNAGYAVVGPIETLTSQEIHDQMEINFFAPIRFTQAVLPSMRDRKSGHIINISSTNAINTPPFGSMYAASKAALESFSESLYVEVKPFNISVSIVEPGLLKTHFSLFMGTKELANNPYQTIVDSIRNSLIERLAHPENLPQSQSAQEIAYFLLGIIQDPHPKLRYQTSEAAKIDVSKKLLDLSGDLYLQEVQKFPEAEGN